MKRIVVAISGKKGSGKTTLGQILVNDYGWNMVNFADSLKEMAGRELNLSSEQTDGNLKELIIPSLPKPSTYKGDYVVDDGYWTPREIMIEIGKVYRSFDKNFWVNKAYDWMNDVMNDAFSLVRNELGLIRFVISDLRYLNEAEFVKLHGGLLVRLERNPLLNIYKTMSDDPSECELDNYNKWDLHVSEKENQTIEDLQRIAHDINKLATKQIQDR